MRLLWRLLQKNISTSQIVGFAIANFVGLTVLLLGTQFFRDSVEIFNQSDSFMKNEYLIISKKVSLLGSVMGSSGTFDSVEISDIESKPFVKSVGEFKSSDFRVFASIGFRGTGISSDIFFESVPDSYIDLESDKWHFEEGDEFIPIIIPRNYLNLYNFGFSQSRNLPRLSESAISMVKFDIKVSGRGKSDLYKGNIIGFSNRLNTILVPDSFMSFASTKYSRDSSKEPSRLIVEVKNSSDSDLLSYLKEQDYDVESNALSGGEMAYFARTITLFVLIIGFIVTLLSIYILILSLFLLLEKNSSKIETLTLIGYSPWRIIAPYISLIGVINFVIMALALVQASILRGFYQKPLSDMLSVEVDGDSIMSLVALLLYITIMSINLCVIRAKVLSIIRVK